MGPLHERGLYGPALWTVPTRIVRRDICPGQSIVLSTCKALEPRPLNLFCCALISLEAIPPVVRIMRNARTKAGSSHSSTLLERSLDH